MTKYTFLLWMFLGLIDMSAVASEMEAMPSAAPAFAATFKTLNDKPIKLAEWKGKVIVLNFWATWCPPCRSEIPNLQAAQKNYASRGVVFIGVAVEDGAKLVRDFVKAYDISYPMLMIESDNGIALLQSLGNEVVGLPFTMILDKQGNVVAVKLGILTSIQLQHSLEGL